LDLAAAFAYFPRMPSLARLLSAAGLALGFWAVAAYGSPPQPAPPRAMAAAMARSSFQPGPELLSFYAERDFQPLWTDGADQALLDLLPPRPDVVAALNAIRPGDRRARLRADMMLSQAFLDAARDSARPPEHNAMRYVDAGLAPTLPADSAALYALAAAPSPVAFARASLSRNPAYDGLVRGLATYRAHWSRLPQIQVAANRPDQLRQRLGLAVNADPAPKLRAFQQAHGLAVTGRPDSATLAALNRGAGYYERLILANIERARAIPAVQGRYVLVDTASARLWMIEDGRIRDSMRVVVGKSAMQTPEMAGLIRYAALNPYWNLPPDLIRMRARNAAARGPRVLADERLQVLSDWTDDAQALDPRRVDWSAVAAGRRLVNMRQLPGPQNMMGRVKFMLPNDLGVYLHDTPHRELFARADRRESSGCVRLEDAQRLGRWLFDGAMPQPNGTPEQQVDLPRPVPVYITYLTVLPTGDGGLVFQRDSYRRDPGAPRDAVTRVAASAPRRASLATPAAPAASRARHARAAAAPPAPPPAAQRRASQAADGRPAPRRPAPRSSASGSRRA
jgi:murein L,D-transpeptidase YcbB/YkuD